MNFEKIKKQAVAIVRQEQKSRDDAAARAVDQPPLRFFKASEFVGEPSPRKQPLRAWAELAAEHITEPEWQEMVWHCADTVQPFKGDVISFFESAFEGVKLKDGCTIWA